MSYGSGIYKYKYMSGEGFYIQIYSRSKKVNSEFVIFYGHGALRGCEGRGREAGAFGEESRRIRARVKSRTFVPLNGFE